MLNFQEKRIEKSKLAYLQPQQKTELLSLLDKYADCFSDVPGFCRFSEHTISLLDSFEPKRLPPYKIPVKLRDEVQKQLNDLEEQGLIRKSTAQWQAQ